MSELPTTTPTNMSYQQTSARLMATTVVYATLVSSELPINGTMAGNQSAGPPALSWLSDSCRPTSGPSNGGPSWDKEKYDDEQLYVKLSTFWYCFLAFITAVGLLVSLVSNMIIIYLFTGTPSLRRNPSNIIAVNLSLSDLLYCIQWPSVIYCSLTQSTWMLESALVCQTFGFITVTTASASVLTVLAMSVERAIVIKYSIYAKSRYTIRSAWFVVVLIWIVSISSSLPPLFGKFNRFTLDPSKTSCTLDYLSSKTHFKLYMLFIYIVYWILPGTIISICYLFIILAFKRSSKNLKQVASGLPSSWSSSALSGEPRLAGFRGRTASSGDSRIRSLSLARINLKYQERPSRRRRFRDSIRLSRFLARLPKRASSLTIVGTDGLAGSVQLTPLDSMQNSSVAATCNRSAENSNRMLTFEPPWRTLRSSTNSNHREPTHSVAPRLESHQSLEQICPEQVAASPSEAQNELPMSTVLEHCSATDELVNVDRETSDRSSRIAAYSKALSMEERRSHERAKRESVPYPTSRLMSSKQPQLKRERRVSIDTAVNFRRTTQGCLADKLAADGDPTEQRPLCDRHRNSVGNSNATISSEPSGTSTIRRASHRRNSRLALISTFASHFDGPRKTFTPSQPMSRLHHRRETSCAPLARPRQALSQFTCHFGNSSSQLSRASMQIRLAKMSFYLILLWLISWTPIASLTLINLIVECHLRANALVVFLANTMTKLGPTFDVFIYGISHPKIKKKFREIIKRLLCLKNGHETEDARRLNVMTNRDRLRRRIDRLNQDRLSTRTTRSYSEAKF